MEGKRNYDTGYWAILDGRAYWHRKRDGAEKRLDNAKGVSSKKILSAKRYDKTQALAHAAKTAAQRR